MQLVTYTMQMLQSVQDGNIWEYLMTPRKYPLFPSLILGVLYLGLSGGLLIAGAVESVSALGSYFLVEREALYLVSRLFVFAMSVGSVVLVYRIATILHGETRFGYAALILLGSSVIFPVFSTAIRPHMPVMFMTLLTVYWSMKLQEDKSLKNELWAFGSAALAFCTLQNGLLAFVFPVFASGYRPKRILFFGLIAGICSVVIGYPFLIQTAFDGLKLGALGNTYFDGGGFTGESMKAIAMLFIGSEFLLTVFSVGGLCVVWRQKKSLFCIVPILVYLVVYVLFFGMQTGSVMRFFFPMIPFLAMIGAPALVAAPHTVRYIFIVFVVLVHIKLGFLGIRPDTFERTHDALMRYPDARIATHLPYYFLDIPPALPLESYRESDIVVTRAGFEPDEFSGFERCAEFGTTPSSQDGLLWSDSDRDWLLLRLWDLKNLGPTIRIYCRADM